MHGLSSGAARCVRAAGVVWATTLVASAGWSAIAAVRESRFVDTRQDLGNFTQAVWATAHGHFLQVTEAGGTEVSRLGIHVDPIIALFAPLWWLWPSPLLLLTVQAFALAFGAVPPFWLGQKHLPRESDAALVAVTYLLCPTVMGCTSGSISRRIPRPRVVLSTLSRAASVGVAPARARARRASVGAHGYGPNNERPYRTRTAR